MSMGANTLGKSVTTELNKSKAAATSSGITGTSANLTNSLKGLNADLKKEREGKKEFEDLKSSMEKKKAELQKRIAANKAWIKAYEENDTAGDLEAQYRGLVDNIQTVYDHAKDVHGKGIDLLIQNFRYHVAYKRWNDTFTSTPFKPK